VSELIFKRALEEHALRAVDEKIDAGWVYYIASGSVWATKSLQVEGRLRVDGELHSFGDITGAGSIEGTGAVHLH